MQREQDGTVVDGVRDATRRQDGGGAIDVEVTNVVGSRAIGTDLLDGASKRNASKWEQVVERRDLDLGPADLRAELTGQPHGHQRERVSIGQIESFHSQHVVAPPELERSGDLDRRRLESELEHFARRDRSRRFERGLDRRDPPERLTHRVGGDVPATPPSARDQTLRPQHLEGTSNRDPTGRELPTEIRLARQRAARAEIAKREPSPKLIGNVQIPHNLYGTCLF